MAGMFQLGVARDALKSAIERSIAGAHAADSRMAQQTAQRDVMSVEKELDRLELLLEAQWSLVREKLGFTDDDLSARVRQLDLLDGKLDGKIERNPMAACDGCGRQTSTKKTTCVYCGVEL